MQQNQPQPEYSQDHIVRRLISKFRKPSDAGAIGLPSLSSSSNLLQVPAQTVGAPPPPGTSGVPTISGQLSASTESADSVPGTLTGQPAASNPTPTAIPTQPIISGALQRSLAGKQSRWSQLVASAAAGASGAASAKAPSQQAGASSSTQQQQQQPSTSHAAVSSTRSLLDITHHDPNSAPESSSNRSSADGRDDEVDENYFRPGGKGHQALLDNMDKR